MQQRPATFLEFPTLEVEVPFDYREKSFAQRRPNLSRVLLAQSLDHGLCLLIGVFLAGVAISLFSTSLSRVLSEATAFFWVAQFTTLGALAMLYRVFFLVLEGATPGQSLLGLRACRENIPSWNYWMRQALESLQVAFPALWVLDAFGRRLGSELSVHYKSLHE
jgi:hypothetical protein